MSAPAPVPSPAPSPVTPAEPGWKTTEFWQHVAVALITFLLQAGIIPTDAAHAWIVQDLGMVVQVLNAGTYSMARTNRKNCQEGPGGS